MGWLKNPDEYFYGSQQTIQRASVRKILNAVVKDLAWNPDRRFSYVEVAFFERYWDELDTRTADLVRSHVASGQLEFINGGWSMCVGSAALCHWRLFAMVSRALCHIFLPPRAAISRPPRRRPDEACTSHADVINNAEGGQRFLRENFNVTPTTTWMIDPFGHSSFFGAVMDSPLAGVDAVFFMRADWQEIKARQAARTTEMVWAPSPTLGDGGSTYAGILYGGYCTETGLSSDFYSDDPPVMDDQRLEGYNVDAVVNATVALVMDALAQVPQGGPGASGAADIMLPLGCDFAWENAASWFDNTDRLIHYLNLDGRVNAFYSTPSAYAAAKLEAGRAYTKKTADFFPYDFFRHGYLTGFYTSRPALKGYIRESSGLYHASMQLQALTGGAAGGNSPANPLHRLERALGVAQHHDAVTGSSKQAVAYDYARRLAWGREDAAAFLRAAAARLVGDGGGGAPPAFAACELANATICPALEAGAATALLVYNQQGRARDVRVRLPVGLPPGVAAWSVAAADGAPLTAQTLPLSAADEALRGDYYRHYPSPCDALPGAWTDPAQNEFPWSGSGGAADAYTVAWAPGGNFSVASSNAGKDGWATAAGRLAADNASVVLTFFSAGGGKPTVVSGAVSAQCDAFFLDNGSVWRLVASAATPPTTPATEWLAFVVPAVPPLGFAVVFLEPQASAAAAPHTHASALREAAPGGADQVLSNGLVSLTYDGATGLLKTYARGGGAPQRLSHYLAWYNSSNGTAPVDGDPMAISGAYIFRPNSSTLWGFAAGAPAPAPSAPASLQLLQGPVLSEARSAWAPWAGAAVRLWAGAVDVEVEHTVGPIPTGDRCGKEVVVRYETGLDTRATFFTDANGRDSMRRVRDARPDFNLTVEEVRGIVCGGAALARAARRARRPPTPQTRLAPRPATSPQPVSGNYYPVSSFIYASSATSGATLSVAVDRAQGGSSVVDGALELMLHRRLLLDDRLGVGEALTEPGLAQGRAGLAVRATHVLSLEATPAVACGPACRSGTSTPGVRSKCPPCSMWRCSSCG